MNLLVVDDEASLLQLLGQYLTRQGHTVEPSATVAGVRALMAHSFDVAVIDWILPDGSGLDLGRELLDHDPTIRVVFTSGYPLDASDVPEGLRDRVRVLQKPFLPRALAEILNNL